jgi:hypothetical protein
MKLQCNECGGTYETTQRDGTPYFHACSPDVIQYAVTDLLGNVTKPEARTPRANPRDENVDDAALKTLTANGTKPLTGPVPIKAAGKGATQI